MSAGGFVPFICVTVNGVVVKLPTPSMKRVAKTVLKGEKMNNLDIHTQEDDFTVCITLTVPFPTDSGDVDWGVSARFMTESGNDPEYVLGVISSQMTHPKVFTQKVPIKSSCLTGIKFKAMPQMTDRKEHREMLLQHLDEVMSEKMQALTALEDPEKIAAEERVVKAGSEELRRLVDAKLRNTDLNEEVWLEFLKHQNKFMVETDVKKELIVSEMFSKKKDPYYCSEAPVNYEDVIVDRVVRALKENGSLELPLLMEILWTDEEPLLRQATRRVLCPNWKVLKEILYDNKNKFEWKTNHNPPYICLKNN
eukprot:TRINITY_DN33798_c0_g1_i1.p1 TRINITY_DN33798_c0_g1~~TRINITY_DN33798_c0_g1_i1.p1  ORF type:complete len:325 (+),score=98.52 TRINITY_DN33798_c0_g1_i1:50-976(+)